MLILVTLHLSVAAQDPLFNTTQQSLIHLNPSFAGSNGLLRYQGIYRNQWYNLSGSYSTFYNSVDAYIKPIRGGIALSYMRDDQAKGTLVTDRIDLSYAQHLSFCDQKLKIIPSVQFSYFQKKLDNSKVIFGDRIDPRRGYVWGPIASTRYSTASNIDLSAGLLVNYKHFYVGGSLFHILRPDEGVMGPAKLPGRLSLFSFYNLFIGEKVLLNAMYRFEQQQNFYHHSMTVNALFFQHLIVSTGFGSKYASVSAGYRHSLFTVSGSYIIGSIINDGCYEVAASFNLRTKELRKTVTDFERW